MFSVKKAGNPPPTLLCVLRFRGRGEGERREYPPCFSEQAQAVGHREALWMLHEASYTVGSMGCIAPTLVFLDRLVSPRALCVPLRSCPGVEPGGHPFVTGQGRGGY